MAGTSRGINGNFDKCHVKWIETDKVQCQVYQQEYMAILINTRYMKMDRSYQSSIKYDQEIPCTSSAGKDGNFDKYYVYENRLKQTEVNVRYISSDRW